MTARLLTLAALLAGPAVAAPLPFPKPAKEKPEARLIRSMQGLWEVTGRASSRGNATVLSTQKYVRVEGTTWTFLRADGTVPGGACEMTFDPTQRPATLDLSYPAPVRRAGTRSGPYMVGRVEVDGDTMRFCYRLNRDRPDALSPAKAAEYAFALRRVKDR
ncbi:MAG: hypothetical protein ACRC33_22125 [Gemmataceae bacterium]